MSFIKAILVGHVINQGRQIYNGGHACLTKENNLSLQQSAKVIITNCDSLVYYEVRWTVVQIATAFLLQSATRFITNCDRYYKV